MAHHTVRRLLAIVAVAGIVPSAPLAGQKPAASGGYQVVKVCPLVSLAEVKNLAPWAPHLDPFAKAEEEALGAYGSSCNYPTVHVQVMAFRQQTIDALRKRGPLEPVAGIGDEAYVQNNRNNYAELYAKIGNHLLTVQRDIGTDETFETVKPSLIALGKTFAAKLR